MLTLASHLRLLLLLSLLGLVPAGLLGAAETASSSFGEIAVPNPAKPASAEQCVEPVEVMRRDHMKFLMHQRDATVIDGERESRYSLVGCMNCHNPANETGEIVRYEDPQHFCAECHTYASVKIDCFECHADRGLEQVQQSRIDSAVPAWDGGGASLSAGTLGHRLSLSQ
jgi:cytochrome c